MSFDSKASSKDKHAYANSLCHELKVIWKQLINFASTLAEVVS